MQPAKNKRSKSKRMMLFVITAGVLIVLALVTMQAGVSGFVQQAAGATPIHPQAQWNRTQSHVAYDSDSDRYLFVWRDKRNDAEDNRWDKLCDYRTRNCWPNADIYGRLVEGDGTIVGTEDFPIATDDPQVGPRDQQWPEAIYNPAEDEYLVTWQEVSPHAIPYGDNQNWYSYCYDIKAQRLNPDGDKIGGPFVVSDARDCQWVPIVSYDSELNKYLLTWHDHRYRGGNPGDGRWHKEIFGQWLAYDDGQLFLEGDNFLVTTDVTTPTLPAPEYQQYSDIAYDYDPDGGDHYVFWSDDRLPDPVDPEITRHHYDIFLQRLDGGSTAAVTNTLIHQAADVQEKPRASFNEQTDEAWAIWQSYQGFGAGAHDLAVEIVRITSDGAPVGDIVTVASGLGSHPYYPLPDVACSHLTGNCLAIWFANDPIYQLFDGSAAPLTEPASLRHTTDWQLHTRVIANNNRDRSEFMMTYTNKGKVFFGSLSETIPTPTNTPTTTPTDTPTPTTTSTPTLTNTPTATATNTPTPTNTPTATATDTPTPTNTPTATPTDTPTPTSTPTATPTETPAPTNTPTATATPLILRFYLPLIIRLVAQ